MSYRRRKRDFVASVRFPRWVVAASILLIGSMLLLGALSDASGTLRRPNLGAVLYIAAIIGIAALVIYLDRTQDSAKRFKKVARIRRPASASPTSSRT